MTEKQIEKMMKSLDLSREEAIQMLLEDEEVDKMSMKEVTSDLSAEQKKTIKKVTQAQSGERAKPKRERKVDEAKKKILEGFTEYLASVGANVQPLTTEAEMHFSLDGAEYTIKLIKHRPPKASK